MPGARSTCRQPQISSSLWQPSASSRTSSASSTRPGSRGRSSSSTSSARGEHSRRRTAAIAAPRRSARLLSAGLPQASTSDRSTEVTGSPSTRRRCQSTPRPRWRTTPTDARPLAPTATVTCTGPGGGGRSPHSASAVVWLATASVACSAAAALVRHWAAADGVAYCAGPSRTSRPSDTQARRVVGLICRVSSSQVVQPSGPTTAAGSGRTRQACPATPPRRPQRTRPVDTGGQWAPTVSSTHPKWQLAHTVAARESRNGPSPGGNGPFLSGSGGLLAGGAGGLAGHDRRVHVLQHDVLGDDDGGDVLPAGDVVHDRLEDLLHDRPQPTGTGAPQDGLVGDRLQGVVGELQLHPVELEQPAVLTHQRVLRLGQDVDQRLAVQLLHAGDHRQSADELRDHAELQQVLGHDLGEGVGLLDLGLAADLGAEADALLAGARLDDLVQPGERATHDEQHVGGVDLDELLMRVLAAPLGRHRGRRPLEDLQQRLLHALTGDVPGDRRVLALAGDLVDLVDVDDPGLGPLDVVVGGLDELEQDVFDVLTDVPGLGERGGVGDGEGDVEHPSQGLRQVGLAAPGRAHQQDVGLGELYALVAAAAFATGLDPLVVVVDRNSEGALGLVLADDVLLEEVVDLLGLRQLVELEV